jgi:hypothetical protein
MPCPSRPVLGLVISPTNELRPSIYEAGRDGFWLHRHLTTCGVDNQVVAGCYS